MERLRQDGEILNLRWLLQCRPTLAAVTFLLYGPTLKYDFSRYADSRITGAHPQLYSDGTLLDRLKQIVYLDFPKEELLIVHSWQADNVS